MNSVSVKGVIKKNNSFLLRKNERNEYELLGGKLEKDDINLRDRLKKEFLEESGIKIIVNKELEPWFLNINGDKVLIIPYICNIDYIPSVLYDQDGGELYWVKGRNINKINIPKGYLDTINQISPHDSTTISKKTKYYGKDYQVPIFLKIINKNSKEIKTVEIKEGSISDIKEKYRINNRIKLKFNKCELEENVLYVEYESDIYE